MSVAELLSLYEYQICLTIGVVVILNFGYKQLKLPLPDSETEEIIPELRGANVLNSAGRTLFFEAYVYFACSLLALYFLMCFSENLYQFLTEPGEAGSNPNPTFESGSGVWPLTVALLIVGLGAGVPVVSDLELFFRKLSRYSAGIYRSIIQSKDKLAEIQFSKLPTSDYAGELDGMGSISAFAKAMSGGTAPDIDHVRKTIKRGLLLHHWSLSQTGPVSWRTAAKDNALSLMGNTVAQVQQLHDDIHAKLEIIQKVEVDGKTLGQELKVDFPNGFQPSDRDSGAAQALWKKYGALVGPLFDEILPSIRKLSDLNDRNETLFALLFTQDRFPKFEENREPGLDAVLQILRSFSSKIIRDMVVRLTLSVIIVTIVITFAYVYSRELLLGDFSTQQIVSSAAKIATLQATGYGVGCIVALICAVAFFRVGEEQLSNTVRREQPFPLGHLVFLFLVCFLLVLTARMILFAVYNFSGFEKLDLIIATLKAVTMIEVLDSIVLSLFSCSFLVLLLKLETVTSTSKMAFGSKVLKHAIFLGIFSSAVVFLGFSATSDSGDIWLPARNSKLLYLVLAALVLPTSLLVVRPMLKRVAKQRTSGPGVQGNAKK